MILINSLTHNIIVSGVVIMKILIFQGVTEQFSWAPCENAATKRKLSGKLTVEN